MAFIELRDIVKSFGRNTVVQGLVPERREGRVRLLPRRIGLRQDDDPADDSRLRDAHRGEHPHRRRGRIEGPAQQAQARHGLPELRPLPQHDGEAQHRLRPQDRGQAARRRSRRASTRCWSSSTWRNSPHRYPHQLSGGQQQRVALARAIAIEPRALLLDEPLSALDAKIRVKLRDDIRDIQRKLGITTIYVTHDQEEALSISDRVAVMKDGLIEQIGAPFEIYNRPATPYVATFIGTLNVLPADSRRPRRGNARGRGPGR